MDGESGDSSSEPHVTAIPSVDDSDSGRKPLEITCVPSSDANGQQPTDFSMKFAGGISRFSLFDSGQRTSEQKVTDLSQKEAPCRAQSEEFDRDGNAAEKDIFRKDSLYRDYLSGKDSFRDFRNSFNVAATESAIGLSKEQQMRASEFAAAALNYNKDPSRTSDIAGMILQHHQRSVLFRKTRENGPVLGRRHRPPFRENDFPGFSSHLANDRPSLPFSPTLPLYLHMPS